MGLFKKRPSLFRTRGVNSPVELARTSSRARRIARVRSSFVRVYCIRPALAIGLTRRIIIILPFDRAREIAGGCCMSGCCKEDRVKNGSKAGCCENARQAKNGTGGCCTENRK